jgi:3-hydroxybutyryl-CoA dehydrogenase
MVEIKNILVLGAGTMGHGIAQTAAQAGFEVSLYDLKQEFIDNGINRITQNLNKGIERAKLTEADKQSTLGRITATTDLSSAASRTDLAIEAVLEQMDLKRQLFGELDRLCPARAILASNTSSLSVTQIANATKRPSQVIGMHFFNPVHIMKLLEVIVADQTSGEALQTVLGVGQRFGKECIVVKDSPGFATSRLGLVLGLEAMRMLESGVASAEDIDKAMALGYNHPMGPLKLTDLVGLDVRLNIAEYLFKEIGEQFRPPEILKQKVSEGKLGQKSGEGFYKWPAK